MSAETYLGDGLYASFDGWMITLRAPREDGDHWVGLEPETYEALLQFVEHIKKRGEPSE
jgi:predicted amidohydrolase YtcJ